MAPSYKLKYFNGRGAAEPSRFIFAYAGVQYEDVRYNYETEWPEYKKNTPYGQLPLLEVDGKILAQSNSIARYLARKYNLAGKNDWESAQCDEIVDAIADLKIAMTKFIMEEDEAKKAEHRNVVKTEKVPLYLGAIEKKVVQNKGFTVGSQFTWSDLLVVDLVEIMERYMPDEKMTNYPSLKALKEKVFAIPSIAAWVKKRPVTEF